MINSQLGKTILVVAAHPDDEVLGCAATVTKYVRSGYEAHLVILTAGVGGRSKESEQGNSEIERMQKVLANETSQSAKLIGYKSVNVLGYPDNRLDTISKMDLALAIKEFVQLYKPELIFTHHPGDYNWDHVLTFEAVMMAGRPNPPEFAPSEILSFEILSSTERAWQEPSRAFHPNFFVDVSKTIEDKCLAMNIYESENRPYPHPRSPEAIRNLAAKRGNEVGLLFAEAFHIIRKIEKTN